MPRPLSRPPWPRASPSYQPRGAVPWPIAGALRPMPAHSANSRRTALRACVPNTKRASLVPPDVVGVGVPARGLAAMGIVRREELIGCREMYDSWGGACMIIGMAPAWWLGRRRHVRGRMGNWCGAVTFWASQRLFSVTQEIISPYMLSTSSKITDFLGRLDTSPWTTPLIMTLRWKLLAKLSSLTGRRAGFVTLAILSIW